MCVITAYNICTVLCVITLIILERGGLGLGRPVMHADGGKFCPEAKVVSHSLIRSLCLPAVGEAWRGEGCGCRRADGGCPSPAHTIHPSSSWHAALARTSPKQRKPADHNTPPSAPCRPMGSTGWEGRTRSQGAGALRAMSTLQPLLQPPREPACFAEVVVAQLLVLLRGHGVRP